MSLELWKDLSSHKKGTTAEVQFDMDLYQDIGVNIRKFLF